MQGFWMPYLILGLTSFVSSLLFAPLAKRFAKKVNAIDYPSSRRINKKPIPRMGGVAIFFALVLSFLVVLYGMKNLGWRVDLISFDTLHINHLLLALSFLTIFITGVLDDIFQLPPLLKLFGQILAAAIACASNLVIGNIVNPFSRELLSLGWLAYPATIIYLVSFANIINLIDGLDGLATGITAISALTMFALAHNAGRLEAAALALVLACACLGFLRYNFNPASIFLGDSGSLLLGFGLGTISLLNVTRIAGLTTIIIPLIIAAVPILDTFSAIVRRKRAHVGITHADKGHLHHRLLKEGYNQRQAVLLIYAWTAMLCIGSYVMTQIELWPRMFIFAVLMLSSALFALHLKLFTPVLLHHYAPHNKKDGKDEPLGKDSSGSQRKKK